MGPRRCNSADKGAQASSNRLCGRYAKGLIRVDEALRLEVCCGGVLLSHNLAVAVPLALPGLASRFGMEAGRFPGAMTTTSIGVQHCPRTVLFWWGCGLIVVCIVVAARRFCSCFLLTRTCWLGCCLVLAH